MLKLNFIEISGFTKIWNFFRRTELYVGAYQLNYTD